MGSSNDILITSSAILDDTIVNIDVNTGAAIEEKKLNFSPLTNLDVIEVTGTYMTTAAVINADMSAKVSGNIIDVALDTSTITAADANIIITDSRAHDGAAADALYGLSIQKSGALPGITGGDLIILHAAYTGTIGASGASSSVIALHADLSGATNTASAAFIAGRFQDVTRTVDLCNGTYAIVSNGPFSLTPVNNNDLMDIVGTNLTSAALIDANLSAKVSGNLIDFALDTSVVTANDANIIITDSRAHDGAAADALYGLSISKSGALPGTTGGVLKILHAAYTGTIGAGGVNSSIFGLHVDLSGATNTASAAFIAGRFQDITNTLDLCNGTHAIATTGSVSIGTLTVDSIDLTPATNIDAIDITGTNMTTAAALDISMSAKVSGNLINIALDTTAMTANDSILAITDSRTHAAGAANTINGISLVKSGNIGNGAFAVATTLITASYTGTINAAAGVLRGLNIDLSGATNTASATFVAGTFKDIARTVLICDSTNALTITGNSSGTTFDATPATDVDAYNVVGTNMTSAAALDVNMSAKTSGNVIDLLLDTSTIVNADANIMIADSRAHDGAAADALYGMSITKSGALPGTTGGILKLIHAAYTGTIGAAGANSSVIGIHSTLAAATNTASTDFVAGRFQDVTRTVDICNGTYAIVSNGPFSLTPVGNTDIMDIVGTNLTSAALIDANLSAKVSGNLLDFALDTSTITANDANMIITDSRAHDGAAADALYGLSITKSGALPGTTGGVLKILHAAYTGTIGAGAANSSVFGIHADLSGATNTASTAFIAGRFQDITNTVDICNGTNALTITGLVALGTIDLTPATDVDAIDIVATNMTSAAVLHAPMSAKTSGNVINLALDTSTVVNADANIMITDSRAHDGLAADALYGLSVTHSGALPGGTGGVLKLVHAVYSGTIGAAGANSSVYGVHADLSGATNTASTVFAAGRFQDITHTTDLCNGTYGLESNGGLSLTPHDNSAAIVVTGTNMTTNPIIDADFAAKVSGNLIDLNLLTATITANDTVIAITDSRAHDGAAADSLFGLSISKSGAMPGTTGGTLSLIKAAYTGTIGAGAGNSSLYGLQIDLSGATNTASAAFVAAQFKDIARTVTVCDTTNAITVTGGDVAMGGNMVTLRKGYQIQPSVINGTNEGIGYWQIASATTQYVYAIFKIPADYPITRRTKIVIDAYWDGNEAASKDLQIDVWHPTVGGTIGGLIGTFGAGTQTSALLTFGAANANISIAMEGGAFTDGINAIAVDTLAVDDLVIVQINGNSVAYGVATNLRIMSIYLESL